MSTAGIVTLLFTDIVGSTELLARLGDEAYEEVRRDHFRLLRDTVTGRGGQEVKNLGDGLMVAFRSTVEGIAAAIEMQQAVEQYNRAGTHHLEVRIGLHVGEPITDEEDYFGTAVVVASRLCDRAAPGQILASTLVRDLAGGRGGFRFSAPTELALKGLDSPVPACEVLWERPSPTQRSSPPALRGAEHTTFVGRDDELAWLESLWESVGTGGGTTALVAGEPGIGKTRLATEFAAGVHAAGGTVLYGRCEEDLGAPYQPFVEALAPLVPDLTPARLTALTGLKGAELARLLPDLAVRVPSLPSPASADAETERYLMFEAVVLLLGALAREAPILLVLDDLQWAAMPTLLLLRHLVRHATPVPIMILGLYRDVELDRSRPLAATLADLRRDETMSRRTLGGLSEDAVGAFLASADDTPTEHLAVLSEALHSQTSGNPFFLKEVVAHLAESGALADSDGRLQPGGRGTELGLPEGVREVITRRLSRLSENANRVLGAGSVIGLTFEVGLLERVTDVTGDDLLDALDDAIGSGVLRESGTELHFSHALIRQTLYAELSGPRRARLHERVAMALEAMPTRTRKLSALAHHFAEAARVGRVEKAAQYALAAGEEAILSLAFEDAVECITRGLEVLELEDDPDRSLRCDLLLQLAETEWATWGQGQETAQRAAEEARSIGSAKRLAQAALIRSYFGVGGMPDQTSIALCEEALEALDPGEEAIRARLLAVLAFNRAFLLNEGVRARPLADQAVELARRAGEGTDLANALFVLGVTLMSSENLEERLALTNELHTLSTATNYVLADGWSRQFSAIAYLTKGDRAACEDEVAGLERLASGVRWWYLAGFVALWKGVFAMMDGRLADAEALGNELMQIAGHDPNFINLYMAQLHYLRFEQGRLTEIQPALVAVTQQYPEMATFRAALAMLHALTGDPDAARRELDMLADGGLSQNLQPDSTWTASLCLLAETCARIGDDRHAGALYALLLPFGGQLAVTSWGAFSFGAADRYLGMLATLVGRHADAERHFEAAANLEHAVHSPPFVARTAYWHARMLLSRGEGDDEQRARALLEQCATVADNLRMTDLEREAGALLSG